jgi:AraC-like DNA-binding protein
LEREFHETLHTSPQRWLDWFRTLKGRELIDAGMRTKEAANLLGFKQASHLCRKLSEARAQLGRSAAKLFTILSLTDNLLPLVT